MQEQKLSFYKWVTNLGVFIFVAFSYFYYAPLADLEQKVAELNSEIEVNNAELENTTSNTAKILLIKTNLARAEMMDSLSGQLNIYRGVAILFLLLGMFAAGFGFMKIKNSIFPPPPRSEDDEEEEDEDIV